MKRALGAFSGMLIAAYPLAVYVGITRFSARGIGILWLLLLLPGLALRLVRARREDLRAVASAPLAIIILVGLGACLNDRRFMLALPVLINLALLVQFGSSLRTTPIVERFARMQESSLGVAQVAYCRRVTQVWCVFFALNATTTALLATFASLGTWALYTGFVAYVLIGFIGSVEYVIRRARFREYGTGLLDRWLARVFPPANEAPGAEALR